jgi:hypothetical protein
MQRHFSSRGEAHAESVAAKMGASRRPSTKMGPEMQLQRRASPAWPAQVTAAAPPKPNKPERKDAKN